jgi:hypothetical protein
MSSDNTQPSPAARAFPQPHPIIVSLLLAPVGYYVLPRTLMEGWHAFLWLLEALFWLVSFIAWNL